MYAELRKKIATLAGSDSYYITGLPVAEDTFGVQMFKQMAISAPIAMVIIFILMLVFFRKPVLVVSPMIVAMVSVIVTMSLLVVTGNTVHIMSSMIPIFIMPIAVLDAVHILSEFFDRYQETKDRRTTMTNVMNTLFTPMLYTSLTTAVGFGSLALAPIPPVQVFGLFIALGVMAAWVCTITFIPAYVMLIPVGWLENFGAAPARESGEHTSPLSRLLRRAGRWTYRRARLVVVGAVAVSAVALWGITRIEVNDNPIKWFTRSHPIRVADRVLNEHFGGTYMAYLALEAEGEEAGLEDYVRAMSGRINERALERSDAPGTSAVFQKLATEAERLAGSAGSKQELLAALEAFAIERLDAEDTPEEELDGWDVEAFEFLSAEHALDQLFKTPPVLDYVAELQRFLQTTGVVGKSNSLADIVKTVNRELVSGEEGDLRIPDTANGVAQCLLQFQSSHRPDDLWHFVAKDYKKTVLWVQLRSGDNRDMSRVADAVDRYIGDNPPPLPMKHGWFGLTYINVIWQQKMVRGMLNAFLGSFLIVFLMMTVLYRSALWGMLSMIPLTVTIGLIYGVIGLIGKDYDMPVAVLSSLSLGLAVDYAIHFLSRSRMLRQERGSWEETVGPVFGEPARAIARNVIVIGVGFLPLLAAPLLPYRTVGAFIAAILLAAGVASVLILPSLIRLLERWLFPETRASRLFCKYTTYVIYAAAAVGMAAFNVYQFRRSGLTSMTIVSLAALAVIAGVWAIRSRREKRRQAAADAEKGDAG